MPQRRQVTKRVSWQGEANAPKDKKRGEKEAIGNPLGIHWEFIGNPLGIHLQHHKQTLHMLMSHTGRQQFHDDTGRSQLWLSPHPPNQSDQLLLLMSQELDVPVKSSNKSVN